MCVIVRNLYCEIIQESLGVVLYAKHSITIVVFIVAPCMLFIDLPLSGVISVTPIVLAVESLFVYRLSLNLKDIAYCILH